MEAETKYFLSNNLFFLYFKNIFYMKIYFLSLLFSLFIKFIGVSCWNLLLVGWEGLLILIIWAEVKNSGWIEELFWCHINAELYVSRALSDASNYDFNQQNVPYWKKNKQVVLIYANSDFYSVKNTQNNTKKERNVICKHKFLERLQRLLCCLYPDV